MIAQQLISDSIPFVGLNDTGTKVLTLMDVFRLSHLPVVVEGEYFGVISDQDIFDKSDFELEMNEYLSNPLLQPHVHPQQHIFELISVAQSCGFTIIPVLSEEHIYQGSVSLFDLGIQMTTLLSAKEPGGILQLKLCENDYSLSLIAQIVEGNDARILSLYTSKPSSLTTELIVTIKLNTVDLSPILQTLTRYDFEVKATYMDQSSIKNLMDDRYDQFIRYMNV